MFHPRPCGCKGQRTCLVCEKDFGISSPPDSWIKEEEKQQAYVYCPLCEELAWPGWDVDCWKVHPNHEGQSVKIPGVKLVLDFLSEEDESKLMGHIDEVPWDLSQSGRKKQNYGPKCNFKKQRVRTDNFLGYPAFTKFIQDRFACVNVLKGFQTVEQCSLDYSLERGSSIDPHIDDCWIWGERIPTVSMLSDSVLTLRRYRGPPNKYNLLETKMYPSVMSDQGTVKKDAEIAKSMEEILNSKASSVNEFCAASGEEDQNKNMNIMRLPMPRRSLLVLYGSPRYDWEHGILREDITTRRVCITYRELTPTFLFCGPQAKEGENILKASKEFWDHSVFYNLAQ